MDVLAAPECPVQFILWDPQLPPPHLTFLFPTPPQFLWEFLCHLCSTAFRLNIPVNGLAGPISEPLKESAILPPDGLLK